MGFQKIFLKRFLTFLNILLTIFSKSMPDQGHQKWTANMRPENNEDFFSKLSHSIHF